MLDVRRGEQGEEEWVVDEGAEEGDVSVGGGWGGWWAGRGGAVRAYARRGSLR